jgi:Kef-type K+ transport system membrane component KefB
MDHLDLPQFLGLVVAILAAAKLFDTLAQWIGQPAVLGELCAGVVLGGSVLGIVNPKKC